MIWNGIISVIDVVQSDEIFSTRRRSQLTVLPMFTKCFDIDVMQFAKL